MENPTVKLNSYSNGKSKPLTKFEVSSSSSFGYMFYRMPKIAGVT